jgi:SAM-dependent methyltransferase
LCHASVFDFFRAQLGAGDISGRRVLEVGSRDVNGSVRSIFMALGATDYLGVDTQAGPGVDRLCDVGNLASEFSGRPFDVVVTTEMLEHVRDWRRAISNLKRVVAPSGLLLITTRSFGFPYHDFPGDYWRYELDDMRAVFRDFEILSLVRDPQSPGVFLKCRKPADYQEVDTSPLKLFCVVKARRSHVDEIVDEEILAYSRHMKELVGMGTEASRILLNLDVSDIGSRDFRQLWQSLERLSDSFDGLRRSSDVPGIPFAVPGIGRVRRRLLDVLMAARLVRGRSFPRARRAILESVAGATAIHGLCVPWAVVDERSFQGIVNALKEIQSLCLKVQSYARPSPA